MTEKPTYEELEKRVQELEKIESEYKSSKEVLRNSEAQYRLLFEHANLGIFVAQDGYLKAPNPYLSHILGYSGTELEDQPFSLFIHPEYLPLVNTRHQERLSGKTGLPQTYDFRVISKNGTIIWVQLSTILIQLKGRPATLNFLHDITERKRAEEALRESEESYRRLADNSPDMIYRMSLPEGRYEYVSPASTHIFGYPPQTWYDNPLLVSKILHPDHFSYFEKQWKNLLKGDLSPSYEYKIIHKDGNVRWVNQRNMLVKDENNRPLAIEGIVTEITERKQAEEELLESKEKYRSMMEAMKDSVYICSPDLRVEYMNPTMIRELGHDATGESCLQAIYGFDKKCPWCVHEKVQKGETVVTELFNPKDGHTYDVSHSPIFHVDDSISKMTIYRDITQRKQMEQALKQSEERFREMADLLPGAIVETDADLRITYVNRQGLKLFDYSEEDIAAGLNGFDLIHPDDREKAMQRFADRLAKKTVSTTEYRVIKKDNESCWVFFNASPIYKTDQIIGFRMVLTDITVRKQIEKEREKLIDELQNALSEIKTLSGLLPICSHCKKIRDDKGYWNQLEVYIHEHTDAKFSHGICQDCAKKHYPDFDIYDD